MQKASFDIKGVFPILNTMVNPPDFRLYYEIALLGVENYGKYYNDPLKRMPIMFGFNVPTFRLMDQLTAEFEYFNTDYLNNPYNQEYYFWPIPVETPSPYDTELPFNWSKWKWAVYAKKNLNSWLYISALVGRDHFFFTYPSKVLTTYAHELLGENLPGDDHWQWILRMGLNF